MPPEPHLRPFLEDPPPPPPDYGESETLFTVVVQHNGFFAGLRGELEYIQSSVEWWDHCSTENWSMHWVDNLLSQMDYERDGKLHVYWSMTGKELKDGLVCLEQDSDTSAMCRAVSTDKTLFVFVDHGNFLKNLRAGAIIRPPSPPVDAFIRPPSPSVGAETDEDDSGDSDFVDSYYEAADGDDDLFTYNVDKEVNDHNELEDMDDLEDDSAIMEDEDMHLTAEIEGHLQRKFKVFNAAIDMKNPEFKRGMVFSDVKEIRKALEAYNIINRVTELLCIR